MFFMQDRFFKGLRLILALDPSKVAIGEIVIDIIERYIIPDLQKDKAREKDDGKKEKIQEDIVEWKEYTNRRGKGSVWNEEAVKVVGNIGNKYLQTESQKEDIAQDVISVFYRRASKHRPQLISSAKKGPTSLLKEFKLILNGLVRDVLRSTKRNRMLIPLETEDRNLNETLSKETDLTKEELRAMKNDMKKWVIPKLKKPAQELFKLWWAEAEAHGPEKVTLKKLHDDWVKATGDTSKNTAGRMSDNWIKIKKQMAKYLKEVEGYELSSRAKKKLKISQVIGDNFIRKRFASWMLEIARAKGEV